MSLSQIQKQYEKHLKGVLTFPLEYKLSIQSIQTATKISFQRQYKKFGGPDYRFFKKDSKCRLVFSEKRKKIWFGKNWVGFFGKVSVILSPEEDQFFRKSIRTFYMSASGFIYLEVSNFKNSLRISSLFIFEKKNGSLGCLLHASPIVNMLGGFLYFTTHFKTGSLILLARHLQFEYSVI